LSSLADRLNHPPSTSELERRFAAIRAAMADAGLDVLVFSQASDDLGGYVKYVTDLPPGGYGTTVVFPRDDDMTVVLHGFLDGDAPGDGVVLRGTKRVLTSPYLPSAHYTRHEPGRLALRALDGYRTIGLAGTAQMPYALGAQLREALPEARFSEESDLLDRIKAIKSPEEQGLIRACARMQDAALAAAFAALEPGMRESELADVARQVASSMGSEAGIVLVGSGRPGAGWTIAPRHLQHRVIQEGDMVAMLVELNGPGGQFAELGRTAVLGEVPVALDEELELVLEAQRFTLERLRPGALCSEVWAEYNEFVRGRGRPEERRIHCHGQGVDLIERPLVRYDEPMAIAEGMHVACHPIWLHDGLWSWTCDNYLIGADGPGTCLHETPQGIVGL
jgi:Xaa-Pro aminopeptidase